MKKIVFTIALLALAACSFGESLYQTLATYSYQDVINYTQPRIASGTTLPLNASGTTGDLFILIATYPALYRHQNGSWTPAVSVATYPVIPPSTATPTNPATGTMWMDGNLKKMRCYDGTSWNNFW